MSEKTGFTYPFEELVRDRYALTVPQWEAFCKHSVAFARTLSFVGAAGADYPDEQIKSFLTITLRKTQVEMCCDLDTLGLSSETAVSIAEAFTEALLSMQFIGELEETLKGGKPPASRRKNWRGNFRDWKGGFRW